ncbi:MAG TPA: IPTL-CTERM sorting domain-containing protein [Bryobacteraceae bacterium]
MRSIVLLLPLFFSSLGWGANALIVHDGIEPDALGNLTTHLTGKGFTVTANVGVPAGSLATYQQIWDIRFNNTTPLTAGDQTAYLTYLAGGGSLFLMGENNTFFVTRNNSIVAFVQAAGGGALSLIEAQNTQTVLAPFTGPTPLASINFAAAAGAVLGIGNAARITVDSGGASSAIGFSPGRLSNAPAGALILVFDVNFMQTGADANSPAFIDNLISYLAAPTTLLVPIPTLSEWGMILMTCCLVFVAARRLRANGLTARAW